MDLPSNLITEVIVVDSNSNDGTPEIAAKMRARVAQEPRRGYGRACLTGLANANAPEVVVFLDGDYSDRPAELPILLAPIVEGRADITLGSRLREQRIPGALPWHQVFGNPLAASLIRVVYGLKIRDLGPFRAGRSDLLRALALEETTNGWAVEMILKAALAGYRVVEVPVSYCPRMGKSKISGTLKGHVRRRLVHSQLDSALLFPAPKTRDTTTSLGPRQNFMKSSCETVVPSSGSDRVLVIMVKAPRPGAVKIRLAASRSPNSPWRNDSECANEDGMCGNEKWVLSGGQPGE